MTWSDRLGKFRYKTLGIRNYDREVVFGVGLSKTGTTSLSRAMKDLGWASHHYPPITRFPNGGHGECELVWPWWLEQYNSFHDITVAATYKQLDRRFPNARFILTLRDMDQWLASCEKHYAVVSQPSDDPEFDRMVKDLDIYLYGRTTFDEAQFRDVYNRHVDDVVGYFANRDVLLQMNVTAGDGWETLCPFLGVDPPDRPFPHRNARDAAGADPYDVV